MKRVPQAHHLRVVSEEDGAAQAKRTGDELRMVILAVLMGNILVGAVFCLGLMWIPGALLAVRATRVADAAPDVALRLLIASLACYVVNTIACIVIYGYLILNALPQAHLQFSM